MEVAHRTQPISIEPRLAGKTVWPQPNAAWRAGATVSGAHGGRHSSEGSKNSGCPEGGWRSASPARSHDNSVRAESLRHRASRTSPTFNDGPAQALVTAKRVSHRRRRRRASRLQPPLCASCRQRPCAARCGRRIRMARHHFAGPAACRRVGSSVRSEIRLWLARIPLRTPCARPTVSTFDHPTRRFVDVLACRRLPGRSQTGVANRDAHSGRRQ